MNRGSGVWLFPPVFTAGFHSDLVFWTSGCWPGQTVVVTLGNAVLVCLYFVVRRKGGRIPQIQWWHHWWWPQRGRGGPRGPTGREPEQLGQHMAPRVSESPPLWSLSFFPPSQAVTFFFFLFPHLFFFISSFFPLSSLHLKPQFTPFRSYTTSCWSFDRTVDGCCFSQIAQQHISSLIL